MAAMATESRVGVAETEDVEAFRAELRAWLAEHAPGRPPRDPAARLEFLLEWSRTLADAGWAAPAWPREWGGRDATPDQQLAYHEEMGRARVPRSPTGLGISLVGPVLIRHGTDEQRARFLPPMLRGDELWCQGFSEPGAGSDLPALTTKGVRVDGGYRVTGQKIWTSNAHIAHWMFALVRTGPPKEGRADGISCLAIDMRAPGVTIRPIVQMTGDKGFSEVFLDEVEVPDEHVFGEPGKGWGIARTTLGFERATAFLAQQVRYIDICDQLCALAAERDLPDAVRHDLVQRWIEVRILQQNAQRTLRAAIERGAPGPESALNRLMLSLFEQRLHEVAMQVLGTSGMLARDDPHAIERGRWVGGFLRTRASTIGSGTAEIQRTTIAERLLGLPREPEAPQ